ncbi:MAG: response regulator [Desulfobacterales bacterium]
MKFTDKGSVSVSAQYDETNFSIRVQDTGIGISEKDLTNIFEEFRQVDGSTARQYEGTGLGLAIAKKATTILGGTLSVTSTLGKGSSFLLTLPILWKGEAPEYEPLTYGVSRKILPEQKTILVVDDEPEVATMISGFLSTRGYNVIAATSGKEALGLAKSEHPFAITLDIFMPDMDGWEVLQELKQDPDTAHIPVIVVSVTDDKQTGFALGAVGYITKPVNRDALIAEINKVGQPGFRTIMIVDDNEIDRQEMARIIEEKELQVIAADGGLNCLKMIEQSLPDVLILDLMMPGMDGFEVLDRLHNDPQTANLPVIVVTAKDLTAQDRKKLSGHVSSVLEKSKTTSRRLLEEITKILSEIEDREPHAVRVSGSKDRVLLVEDSDAVIIQVKTVLQQDGYEVDVAKNGQEALDYVQHTIPDGIVLDLMMPEVDGFEVLEKIRSRKETANIPVLVLTAKDLTMADRKKLTANHIQQLIQKGDVDQEGLLSKVREMLGKEAQIEPKGKVPASGPAPIRRSKGEKRPTILAVEDNPDNMTTIRALLGESYNLLEAIDGRKGLTAVLEQRPDLILLDMSLPEMDGFQVVREIKENKEVRGTPVIAMTAHAMKGDREKILEAGCDDYVSKPVDPEGFLKKINKWLLGAGD